MKIGVNSFTVNNDIDILKSLRHSGLIDTYECSKYFYKKYSYCIDKLDIPCETFSSLITKDYDINDDVDWFLFIEEFEETIKMAKDVGATKLMFGLSRFRNNLTNNHYELFGTLVNIAKQNNMTLLYEAISPKLFKNDFLRTHDELIEYSIAHDIDSIHVDFGTLRSNGESFGNIADKIKVSNIHFPYGELDISEVKNHDISIENYNNKKLSVYDIADYLRKIKESI